MNSNLSLKPATLADQLMAVDVFSDLLASTDPKQLGRRLTEQLRELTGARTVMLIAHPEDAGDHKLIHVCPTRRVALFTSGELDLFYPDCSFEALPRRAEEFPPEHPLRPLLLRVGVESLLRFPLRVGGKLLATLLLLDLPGLDRIDETAKIVTHLSPVMAMALKNSFAHEQIEQQTRELEFQTHELERRVGERTAELEAANKLLATSRLAALNMMEEAVAALNLMEETATVLEREVNERKQAEESLRELNERFSMALEVGNAGVWEWYLKRDEVSFDARFHELLGYTPGELPNTLQEWLPYHHPEDVPIWMPKAQAYLRGDSPIYESEHRIRNKAGTWSWVFTRGKLVNLSSAESPEHFIGIAMNVTERRQAEENLQKSEENFRRSLDDSPLGARIVSAAGETIYANRTLLDIYGYDSIEELQGISAKERYTPESYAEFLARREKRRKGDNAPSEYEISIIRKDREVRRLQVFRKEIVWNGAMQFQILYNDISKRKRAEAALQISLDKLRITIGAAIRTLAATVEMRDPSTAGHQQRVADLARHIAREMSVDTDRIFGLGLAALVHDIGKIGVPAEILSKPTKLTKLEFSLIQTHAQTAYDILKDMEFPWPIAEIVYQHHERLDGSGYPRGLPGEEISLDARILAVADVVEAMSSHRPYRPGLGIDAALAEIAKNRGVLYDPDIVDVCLRLFREKGFTFS